MSENNHLSKEELRKLYAEGTSSNTVLWKKLKRRLLDMRNKKGIEESLEEMKPGYHYFVCPVSGLPTPEISKNHAKRIGLTYERFLEHFPEFEGVVETPYSIEVRNSRKEESKKDKPVIKEMKTFGNFTIDVIELKRIIRKNYETRVEKQLSKNGINLSNAIENYHFFKCPITEMKITGYTSQYFDKIGMTKEDFEEYFNIDTNGKYKTPFTNGWTIEEWRKGEREEKISNYYHHKFTNEEKAELSTRYMHVGSLEEYMCLILSDPVFTDFVKYRNKRGESNGLNDSNLREGYDYLICPIGGYRFEKFNRESLWRYGVTFDKLKSLLGGNFVTSCSGHSEKISKGQQALDEETGLTKHELSVKKSAVTRKTVNPETGLTPNQQIGVATKKAHKTNIDKYGRDGYQRLADEYHDRRLETRYGTDINISGRQERYERIIELITNRCRSLYEYLGEYKVTWGNFKDNYNPEFMHLDHKFSRSEGYTQGISPLCIAHLNNIDYVKMKDNLSKRDKCSITIDQLATINHMSVQQMKDEFTAIMKVIDDDIKNNVTHNCMNVLIRAGHDIALKMRPYNMIHRRCREDDPDMSIDLESIVNNL